MMVAVKIVIIVLLQRKAVIRTAFAGPSYYSARRLRCCYVHWSTLASLVLLNFIIFYMEHYISNR